MQIKKLINSSAINLVSMVLPALAALPIIGHFAKVFDKSEFNLILLLMGFLSLVQVLDLGYSKSITHLVSNNSRPDKIETGIGNSLFIVAIIGIIFASTVELLSKQIVALLNLESNSGSETSLIISSFSIPLYLCVSIFQGYFEGNIEIKKSGLLKIITGTSFIILPYICAQIWESAVGVSIGFLTARTLALMLAVALFLGNGINPKINLKMHKDISHFGNWLTLSNIISPIMSIGDKFYLSTIFPHQQVSQYSISNETVMRMLVFPGAISRALFPLISKANNNQNILRASYLAVFAFLFLTALPLYIFAEEIIKQWLGNEFTKNSAEYLRILTLGFACVSISQIPYSAIQAKHGARPTALMHLIQLPIYLIILFVLVSKYGIAGAAYAWNARLIIDLGMLLIYQWRCTAND